jgi:uncharacterized membrane protein HdeD (DUF308 family)
MSHKSKLLQNIVMLPFVLCTSFLRLLGKCFRLNYKQISVIFNLYFQGALLLISGVLPLISAFKNVIIGPNWYGWVLLFVCALYFSIYIIGFIAIIRHYHLPLENAFDTCVKDLLLVAEKWHISYQTINLIIFIFWWLTLIGVNICFSYCIVK